jgi:hypothetical protein
MHFCRGSIHSSVKNSIPRFLNIRLYRPANLEAYDLCLRGRAEWAHSPEAGVEAIRLFEQAIALDPNYAEAYRWLAISQTQAWAYMDRPMDPFRRMSITSPLSAADLCFKTAKRMQGKRPWSCVWVNRPAAGGNGSRIPASSMQVDDEAVNQRGC